MTTAAFAAGGYCYIPAVFQYSGGVAAEPGFEIVRFRFRKPVALSQGFARIETIIRDAGRPLTAFCACELHSPAPFTEDGFRAFNEIYVGTLRDWGIMVSETNPVARSNICPQIDPPAEPSFHAFCFTVTAKNAEPSFVVSGSAEAKEGKSNYRDHTIRLARRHRTRSAKRRAMCSARWSGGWLRSDLAGPTRPPRRSIPCMMFIHFWRTNSSVAARCRPG